MVMEEQKMEWAWHLWNESDRARILEMMKAWSRCDVNFVSALNSKFKEASGNNVNEVQERQHKLRIMQLEYQAFRSATAVLALGHVLNPNQILSTEATDAQHVSWFEWAVKGQKEGIPSLKYLMKSHYALILKSVLSQLYLTLGRGAYAEARMFFDVIVSLDLPDRFAKEIDAMDICKQLAAFCLLHMIPFMDKQILMNGRIISHHQRDASCLTTFRGLPTDSHGASFVLSVPTQLSSDDVEYQTAHPKYHMSRCSACPRLYSPILLTKGITGHSARAEDTVAVHVAEEVMHALNMSRRAFDLFYKLVTKLSNPNESLDRLFELRNGLQSSDLRDVKHNVLQINVLFANVMSSEVCHEIVSETLGVLENMIAQLHPRAEQESLSAMLRDNHLMWINNLLQMALPWFANAPLHTSKDPDAYMGRLFNLTLQFRLECLFNIDRAVQYFVRLVVDRYEAYDKELQQIDEMAVEAKHAMDEERILQSKPKSLFGVKSKAKLQIDPDNSHSASSNARIDQMRRTVMTPEQLMLVCEAILQQVLVTHSESLLSSLLQFLNVGSGLGTQLLVRYDGIPQPREVRYTPLQTQIVVQWLTSLTTRSFFFCFIYSLSVCRCCCCCCYCYLVWEHLRANVDIGRVRSALPILITHSLLFVSSPPRQSANPCAELLSHLFVGLLPPRIVIDDEIIQLAMWIRDRRTLSNIYKCTYIYVYFQWNEQPITDLEPSTTSQMMVQVEASLMDTGTRLQLDKLFAKKTAVIVDDLSRLMFACFKSRYGTKETINAWGLRCLQWATAEMTSKDVAVVSAARQTASHALRLYCMVLEPFTLKAVAMLVQLIIRGLQLSQNVWDTYPREKRHARADPDILLVVRGVEALTVMLQAKKEWSKPIFRVVLVIFWVALTLLQCKIAVVQNASRK
ncbi:hypothetical protein RFI_33022, partial [Reticulomyxa filosa]